MSFYLLSTLSHNSIIETKKTTSVLIIGAGPTGLSLAVQLLRYGVDFIILEKNDAPTPYSKALVIQARTLEIFAEAGLAQKAISMGRYNTGMSLYYKGKRKGGFNLTGLGKDVSPFAFALSLEQSKTEQLLLERLAENGKTVHWKTNFIRYEQQENGITAWYTDAEEKEQQLSADYIVGCDGAHSPVRRQLGATFGGDTIPKLFYVADVTLNSPVVNKNQLFIFLLRKGFVIFFPMEGADHYRLIGILPEQPADAPDPVFEEAAAFIKANIVTEVNFTELRWFSTYKVHSRMADTFMKERCFIAGDAAHIHTPAGGQGMNTGVQDAYNLAWKIAMHSKGELKTEVLSTYNTERMGNARNLLKTTDRMFDIMAGTNWFMNFMRLHILPKLIRFISRNRRLSKLVFPVLSQTNIAYPDSKLSIKSALGKLKAGDRMHYFVFNDGSSIFDHIKDPAFKLLFFGDQNGSFPVTTSKNLVCLSFNEIPGRLFGKETNFYILLRPDNHISYIGKDLAVCKKFLTTLLTNY